MRMVGQRQVALQGGGKVKLVCLDVPAPKWAAASAKLRYIASAIPVALLDVVPQHGEMHMRNSPEMPLTEIAL